jgi:hypothetical protein
MKKQVVYEWAKNKFNNGRKLIISELHPSLRRFLA